MKVIKNNHILYIKNVYCLIFINADDDIVFIKNYKYHNRNGPAVIKTLANPSHDQWWCYGKCYGHGDKFSIKSWKKKCKNLKYKERMKIFI